MDEPELGEASTIRRSTTRTSITIPRRNRRPAPKSLDEVDPELLRTYEKLGIPLREQEILAGVERPQGRGRRGVRLRLGRDDLQGRARRARHHLLLVLRGGARASRAGAQISRHRRAAERQFLRGAQLGGVQRRLVRLHPAGRALPDGAVDLFPHQRAEDRPVRAHAAHRRQGRLCQLSRRLHRAAARREPAACRGRRADRARRRRDQIFDRAELVSGRRRGQGRHLQFRHQARRLPRRARRRSPGPRSRPARRSPGNIRAASCEATIRSANSIRSRSPTTASRPTPAPR